MPQIGRFDRLKSKDADFVVSNGLVEQNEQEKQLEYELFNSSVPISTLWKNKDDTKKLITWNDEWEEYLEHRRKLIELAPIGTYFPWNIAKTLRNNFANGLALNQSNQGSCAGAAYRNALLASDMVNAKFAGYDEITETGVDMVYALARGNGRLAWGGGCNGTPIVKYGTEIGNYRTSDLGPYDPRGRNVTTSNFNNATFKANAFKHQSICCYLPDTRFDTFYKALSAGFSVWIGSSRFPSNARIENGISIPNNWTSGNHATCFQMGITESGRCLLYWQNSHGDRYRTNGDKFETPYSGTWVDESNFGNFQINQNFGTPFAIFGELIEL